MSVRHFPGDRLNIQQPMYLSFTVVEVQITPLTPAQAKPMKLHEVPADDRFGHFSLYGFKIIWLASYLDCDVFVTVGFNLTAIHCSELDVFVLYVTGFRRKCCDLTWFRRKCCDLACQLTCFVLELDPCNEVSNPLHLNQHSRLLLYSTMTDPNLTHVLLYIFLHHYPDSPLDYKNWHLTL